MNYLPVMIIGTTLCAVALCVLLVLEGGEKEDECIEQYLD